MASEKPDKKKDKKEKKKEKKQQLLVEGDEAGVKKQKKEKKEKKEKKAKLAAALEEHLQKDAAASLALETLHGDGEEKEGLTKDSASREKGERTIRIPASIDKESLVPFAVPLADEKGRKKTMKMIKRAAKTGLLKRGVKEVVKTLRKSPLSTPQDPSSYPGIVVLASDVFPYDVISHLPVLCEDHNVPYIFVPFRAELGLAAKTKRATSVVMIMEKRVGGKTENSAVKETDDVETDSESWPEAYREFTKVVEKETSKQAFWTKGSASAA